MHQLKNISAKNKVIAGVIVFGVLSWLVMLIALYFRLEAVNKESFIAYMLIESLSIIMDYYFAWFILLFTSCRLGYLFTRFYMKNSAAAQGFKIMGFLLTALIAVFYLLIWLRTG